MTAIHRSSAQSLSLSAIPLQIHEQAMQLAIAAARHNPSFPFGAVIVRAADRQIMATGVNNGSANPVSTRSHPVVRWLRPRRAISQKPKDYHVETERAGAIAWEQTIYFEADISCVCKSNGRL